MTGVCAVSSVLYRIALACYRNRLRTLLAWVLVLVVVGGSALLAPKQFDDGFKIPGASSQLALEQLQVTFPDAADASAILLITAPEGERMDDKGVKAEAEKYFDYLSSLPYIKGVTSPYVEQLSGQISSDGRSALARVRIVGSASEFSDANREALLAASQRIGDFLPGATANIGGDVYSIHMPKLGVTEAFSLVVAVVVLVMALGSLVGAMIPVATACAGVALGASITVIDATLATVSATTLILAVMLGLAVGIDYALFIVSRHRDQLGAGMDVEESAARAVGTAGSAVVFAGTTVIIALIGLSVANLPFLTIMGCLSAATVAFAVLLALTLLPALLGFAGERLRPKRARLAQTGADAEDGAA
ncbi:MAG: MMPL family transporter, partial [Propionibacteriaceae bacterium]|nr:MMPL family transporter [Propionibacteriaceae bacterium]